MWRTCVSAEGSTRNGSGSQQQALCLKLHRLGLTHLSKVLCAGRLLKAYADPQHGARDSQVVLQPLEHVLGSDAVALLVIVQHHLSRQRSSGGRQRGGRGFGQADAGTCALRRMHRACKACTHPRLLLRPSQTLAAPAAPLPPRTTRARTLKRISSLLQALQGSGCAARMVSITLPDRLSTAWHEGHTT
jgi:hypothetical protein